MFLQGHLWGTVNPDPVANTPLQILKSAENPWDTNEGIHFLVEGLQLYLKRTHLQVHQRIWDTRSSWKTLTSLRKNSILDVAV